MVIITVLTHTYSHRGNTYVIEMTVMTGIDKEAARWGVSSTSYQRLILVTASLLPADHLH